MSSSQAECPFQQGDVIRVPKTKAKAEVVSTRFSDWSGQWYVVARHLETDAYRSEGQIAEWYASDVNLA